MRPDGTICAHCQGPTIAGDLFCTGCGWVVGAISAEEHESAVLRAGATFPGGYRALREGGRGATSTVWHATEESTGRHVAVKELSGDSAMQRRFIREATFSRKLVHPNIVPQIGAWLGSERMFSVMPWIEGASLRELLDDEGAFETSEALWIAHELSCALSAAHDINVVHRDVKPANVLVDLSGTPLLCDFGIAKNANDADVTHTGASIGSPAYMSPEQIRGNAEAASDQYALGVVLFELLTGARPFSGSAIDVQISHLTSAAPSLEGRADRAGKRFSVSVTSLVTRMLQKSPADRWPSLEMVSSQTSQMQGFDPNAARSRLAARVARIRLRRALSSRLSSTTARALASSDADNNVIVQLPPMVEENVPSFGAHQTNVTQVPDASVDADDGNHSRQADDDIMREPDSRLSQPSAHRRPLIATVTVIGVLLAGGFMFFNRERLPRSASGIGSQSPPAVDSGTTTVASRTAAVPQSPPSTITAQRVEKTDAVPQPSIAGPRSNSRTENSAAASTVGGQSTAERSTIEPQFSGRDPLASNQSGTALRADSVAHVLRTPNVDSIPKSIVANPQAAPLPIPTDTRKQEAADSAAKVLGQLNANIEAEVRSLLTASESAKRTQIDVDANDRFFPYLRQAGWPKPTRVLRESRNSAPAEIVATYTLRSVSGPQEWIARFEVTSAARTARWLTLKSWTQQK